MHAGHAVEPDHAVGKGAHAGQDDPVGAAHRLRVGGDEDFRVRPPGHPLEGILGRFEIARPIIDDRDCLAHGRAP